MMIDFFKREPVGGCKTSSYSRSFIETRNPNNLAEHNNPIMLNTDQAQILLAFLISNNRVPPVSIAAYDPAGISCHFYLFER